MSQDTRVLVFADVWKELLRGIEDIYQLRPMTQAFFMKLFSLVYDYCSNVKNLTNNVNSRTHAQANNRSANDISTAQIVGEELYMNIKSYLTNHLEAIFENGVDLQGDKVLRFYSHHWSQYKVPSIALNSICSYLNNHWIRRTIDDRVKKEIYEVFPTAMKIWERMFFNILNKQVTEACLNLIKAERNHEVINTNLISEVMQSYVTLDSCQSTPTSESKIYKQFFEDPFLQDTEQFYLIEAANFLRRNSVTEYLRKVAQRLEEEVHRVQSYLHPSTLPSLTKKVEDVLIRDQLDVIYTESQVVLRDERNQDLILLFKLVSRVPDAIGPLRDIVENYIHQMGSNAIERINETALSNPKIYIETILNTYEKFVKLVKEVFNNQQEFVVALDRACVKFINHNVVTQSAGNTNKSAELLARYCDILLRKGNKGIEDSELEEKFNDILAIFNYMEDKDVFEKFYRNRLAKRLVGQLSASDDHEELMISKLKQICGYEYTWKLQRMFQDISVSKNLTNQYRTNCESRELNDIDFSVMVLTSNSWPFSAPASLILPIEIQLTIDDFTRFYSQQHSGRKLMWLYQHWKVDLQTLFTKPKYILQVSTYQMNILLLFNQQTRWTVERIQDRTQISKEILLPVLDSLLKSKLLICEDVNDGTDESDIQLHYRIKLAENFHSKNIRINLNVPLKSVEQKENDTVHRTIDDDRNFLIQAAIVRIMKARQTLKHALLMKEVIEQLSSRFRPQIPQIKRCIDSLIETGYLERDASEKDILRYVA